MLNSSHGRLKQISDLLANDIYKIAKQMHKLTMHTPQIWSSEQYERCYGIITMNTNEKKVYIYIYIYGYF